MLDNKIANVINFFKEDLWKPHFDPKKRSYFRKLLRICISTTQNFQLDECFLKASALTFYSLLSVVPILAVGFGFAKGFGFSQLLEREIKSQFHEQPEIANKIIEFSYSALAKAQGGIIAGVGVAILLWTIIKLLANIESSFNDIWKVPAPRSFIRKLSDYLAIIIFCPIFFGLSSSFVIYIYSEVMRVTHSVEFLGPYTNLIFFSLHIIPYFLCWLLFSFIYVFMPNTKVPWKYAIIAGIVAGTAYQIIQLIYIRSQIGVGSYGAIYGSFAALPLFLVWLNLSWITLLAGAEIAYAAENDALTYGISGEAGKNRRLTSKEVLGLLIVDQCVQAFCKGEHPLTTIELTNALGAVEKVVMQVIEELVEGNILSEVVRKNSEDAYQPSRNVKDITLKHVCDALNISKIQKTYVYDNQTLALLEQRLAEFDAEAEKCSANTSLEEHS